MTHITPYELLPPPQSEVDAPVGMMQGTCAWQVSTSERASSGHGWLVGWVGSSFGREGSFIPFHFAVD